MSAAETTGVASELSSLSRIRTRYGVPGQHATVVLERPSPAQHGNVDTQWASAAADLRQFGASATAIDLLGQLLDSTPRGRGPLLLTANNDTAALCWLDFETERSISVAPLPELLPALHQTLLIAAPTLGAVVDRSGADFFCVDRSDIEYITTIEGAGEVSPKPIRGARAVSRNENQREVVWERNAALISTGIVTVADRIGTYGVMLTGDLSEVRLVESQLNDRRPGPVVVADAGVRHHERTAPRLRDAVIECRRQAEHNRVLYLLAELDTAGRAEGGAARGSVDVRRAIDSRRVGTLFVDLAAGRRSARIDEVISAALFQGVDVVTGADFDVPDGVAAILRPTGS